MKSIIFCSFIFIQFFLVKKVWARFKISENHKQRIRNSDFVQGLISSPQIGDEGKNSSLINDAVAAFNSTFSSVTALVTPSINLNETNFSTVEQTIQTLSKVNPLNSTFINQSLSSFQGYEGPKYPNISIPSLPFANGSDSIDNQFMGALNSVINSTSNVFQEFSNVNMQTQELLDTGTLFNSSLVANFSSSSTSPSTSTSLNLTETLSFSPSIQTPLNSSNNNATFVSNQNSPILQNSSNSLLSQEFNSSTMSSPALQNKTTEPTINASSNETSRVPSLTSNFTTQLSVQPPSISPSLGIIGEISNETVKAANSSEIENQNHTLSSTLDSNSNGTQYNTTSFPSISSFASSPTVSSHNLKNSSNVLKMLETTYDGKNYTKGVMFDVKAMHNIQIISFDIHTIATSNVTYEVYTKKGTHRNFEQFSSSWRIISSGTTEGKGESSATALPSNGFEPVLIEAKSVQSFYITLLKPYLVVSIGSEIGAVYSSNSDAIVNEGVAVKEYPFGVDLAYPFVWNGAIHYKSQNDSSLFHAMLPSSSPSTSSSNSSSEINSTTSSQPTKISTFLFGFFLNYPSSKTFLPSVKASVDKSILSILQSPPMDRIGLEIETFYDENEIEILVVNSIPVDIDENDGRCPEGNTGDQKCGAINVYVEVSHLEKTSVDEIRKSLASFLPFVSQGIEYKARYIEPVIQSSLLLISLENFKNITEYPREDIAFFESIIFGSLIEKFSIGLLPFEVIGVEVLGDSLTPTLSADDRSQIHSDGDSFKFSIELAISTRHFVLHDKMNIEQLLKRSLTADSESILERLQTNSHFAVVTDFQAHSMLLDDDVSTDEIVNKKNFLMIVVGGSIVLVIASSLAFVLFGKKRRNNEWQAIDKKEAKSNGKAIEDIDEEGSTGEQSNDPHTEVKINLVVSSSNTDSGDGNSETLDDGENTDNRKSLLPWKRSNAENSGGVPLSSKNEESEETKEKSESEKSFLSSSESILSTGTFDDVIWRDDVNLPDVT